MGARRGQDAGGHWAGHQARHRPRRAMGPEPRSVGPFGRDALRAGGTGPVRQGRHADCRDRGAACQEQSGTRVRADGLWAGVRRGTRARHDRRHAGRKPLRPAPHQGGRRARSFSRLHGGVGTRRDLQVGRPRCEERHRLRPLQAAGRLVRHARGDDRRDREGAAARRDRTDRAGARARRCGGNSRDERRDELVERRVGRRAFSGAHSGKPSGGVRQADHRAAARRRRAVGRASAPRARSAAEAARRDRGAGRGGLARRLAGDPQRHAVHRRRPRALAHLGRAIARA